MGFLTVLYRTMFTELVFLVIKILYALLISSMRAARPVDFIINV
jgi:hypothetical protein